MTNREIRRWAKVVFFGHYLRLLPPLLIQAGISVGMWFLITYGSASLSPWESIIRSAVAIITAPVLSLGFTFFYMQAWQGRTPRVRFLTQRIDSPKVVWSSIRLAAFQTIAVFLSALWMVPFAFLMQYLSSIFHNPIVIVWMIVMLLVTMLVALWISYRLSLLFYARLIHPEKRDVDVIKLSWDAMKGYCWRFCLLGITTSWPLFVTTLVCSNLSRNISPYFTLLGYLLTAAWSAYPSVAAAGFLLNRLTDYENPDQQPIIPKKLDEEDSAIEV